MMMLGLFSKVTKNHCKLEIGGFYDMKNILQ